MALSLFASVHWAATLFIEVVILVLALRRNLFERLPIFTAYLCILVANELAVWLTYWSTGITSHVSFYVYWTMQAAQVLTRGAVVYEICKVLLSPYTGVWKLCRPLLVTLGLILTAIAGATAHSAVYSISVATLMAERGLEFTVVGLVILGLLFCRYYRIRIERYLAWIVFGLGFYSAIQVANNTFLGYWFTHENFLIWQGFHEFSFNITTILWIVAIWKPLPAAKPAPILLNSGEYDNLAPQITLQLRELNARLLEIWK